ncbi:MAG TPA: Xaa-Pro peptidase family protein [Terriglobia bacterium]|nr:Xaa-Pro peptidase family protein [Terriglobia bacterium]
MSKRLSRFAAILVAALSVFLASAAALEKAPLTEYRARRASLAREIAGRALYLEASPESELVKYYPEPNFYYLTGFEEPSAALLIDATQTPPVEYLFLPARNLSEERWTGVKLGPGPESARATGFESVLPLDQARAKLVELGEGNVLTSKNRDVMRRIAAMRQVKSASEIALIEKAVDITMKGLRSAALAIAPGAREYEVEAALEFEFRKNGAERPGFPSIVGSGPYSTILHYNKSERRMESGDLVVVDVGAEYSGYTADVTRTFPVSGKFTPRQREIYQIVLDAQKAAIAAIRPGARIRDVHAAAVSVIRAKGYNQYFIHGTSHHMGLEVHDVGDTNRALEVGMVITAEPGIYIPEESLGVRIEDDLVVTPDGARLLSTLPREIDDIEKLMKR